MKQDSRTRTATTKRIAAASLVNRVISMVCRFAARSVFAAKLGKEYLGVGGMFGNIFGVLTIIEGGIGEAVSQQLYRPLASGDAGSVAALFGYYTRICRRVAAVTLLASLTVMPFLPLLFRDIERIEHYRAVYLLFVVHQMLSYLFSPSVALLTRDRRGDLLMNCRSVTGVVSTLSRIVLLQNGGSYLTYTAVHILFSAVDGVYACAAVRRRYPYLYAARSSSLPETLLARVKHSAGALYVHRVAAVIDQSTDSLLISSVLGLTRMGVFSNYSLIVGTVGSFVTLLLGSASSSVGHLGATENAAKSIAVLERLCRVHLFLVTNAAAVLLAVITPVISVWQGRDMCFGSAETAVIAACFYFSYVRAPVQIFLNAYGVFRETKYLYLARGILNLLLSLLLVGRFGVVGVFGGTLLSTALTVLPLEPYMLFRYGFHSPPYRFVKRYCAAVLGGAAVAFGVNAALISMPSDTPMRLAVKAAAVLAAVNAALCAAVFCRKAFAMRPIRQRTSA